MNCSVTFYKIFQQSMKNSWKRRGWRFMF